MERDSRWCKWLKCGQFRAGTDNCPNAHLKFRPGNNKCHACVGTADAASAALRDGGGGGGGGGPAAAEATPTTAANSVDGLSVLQEGVLEHTGAALPHGWRALVPPNAVANAAQTGEFIAPDGTRVRNMASVLSHVQQLATSSTHPSLPALLDMSSPSGVAGASATHSRDDAASAAPAPLASSTAVCALSPAESASSTARTRTSDLIGREVALPGTSKHGPADGIVVGMLPDTAIVRWDVANDVRHIPFPEIMSMLLPPPPRAASFAEEQQRRLQSDEQENKRRRQVQSGESCIEHLPPCVREVLTFGQEGDEQQPWGPLQRPADPIGAPLSNDELMLSLRQSALRTGKPFDQQSIEFDADATLLAARIRIVLILHASMPGAVKYEVQNIGSTNAALLGLLGKVTWSGKHMGILKNSQSDGKRRFILFSALLMYFEEEKNNAADLALCRVVVHRFRLVATYLLIGFRLPPDPHKVGVMLTQWGATDQSCHNDSMGVKDTYSSVLPLMNRGLGFARADGGVHTMNMAVANNAEGTIFESHLKHWGKGAPLPQQSVGSIRSASVSKPLPGFDMPRDGSSSPASIRIESAAIHYYGGKKAMLIPISDKRAELAHHDL